MEMGAIFDPTGAYRYSLWRQWDTRQPRLAFVMLNPSTADTETDDATIRRCVKFARTWKFGALEVVNLFAFRATQPQILKQVVDPVGVECDRYLLAAADQAQQIVVAWGNGGRLHQRDQIVLDLLASHKAIYCLGMSQAGQPRHPLYLRSEVKPILFKRSL